LLRTDPPIVLFVIPPYVCMCVCVCVCVCVYVCVEWDRWHIQSNHLVINFENDKDLILKPGKTLEEQGVENEHEISCFIREEYEEYKKHPENK
jgi:hypothetical protein